MKIFVMWSGAPSRKVAEAIRDLVHVVVQGVECFVSSQDIKAGWVWERALESELAATHFGVAVLTRTTLSAPWILFESGAIAKVAGDSNVVPYLLDVRPSALVGPLSRFQSVGADEDGTARLMEAINAARPSAARLDREILGRALSGQWEQFDAVLNAARADLDASAAPEPAPPPRSAEEMLAEILETVRDSERAAIAGRPGAQAADPVALQKRAMMTRWRTHVRHWGKNQPSEAEAARQAISASGKGEVSLRAAEAALQAFEDLVVDD